MTVTSGTGYVGTYNYEMDSGSYFFRLVHKWWMFSGELIPVRVAHEHMCAPARRAGGRAGGV
jgi:hypothetical protein